MAETRQLSKGRRGVRIQLRSCELWENARRWEGTYEAAWEWDSRRLFGLTTLILPDGSRVNVSVDSRGRGRTAGKGNSSATGHPPSKRNRDAFAPGPPPSPRTLCR